MKCLHARGTFELCACAKKISFPFFLLIKLAVACISEIRNPVELSLHAQKFFKQLPKIAP
jgi:hypothetical protein